MHKSPLAIAYAQALMAWNGEKYIDAMNDVIDCSQEELSEKTYADSSFMSASEGVSKHLLNGKEIPMDYLNGEVYETEEYYDNARAYIYQNMSEKQVYASIIDILDEIHNKWVEENAKKYNRDANNEGDKKDKRLFQHLPLELIGIDEVAKDLMFLSPILAKMDIDVGTMTREPYGAFVPNQQIVDAYKDRQRKYFYDNRLDTQNVSEKIVDIINNYKSLDGQDEVSKQRKEYMKEHTEKLCEKVKVETSKFDEKEDEMICE